MDAQAMKKLSSITAKTWTNALPFPKNLLPVSQKKIRNVESELKTKFPIDYLEFLSKYGPGELCGWLRIHSPSFKEKHCLDLLKLNQWMKKNVENYDCSKAIQTKLRDAILFADTPSGDIVFWLRNRISLKDESVFLAESRPLSVKKIAGSFRELIVNFTEGKLKRQFGGLTIDKPIEYTSALEKLPKRSITYEQRVESRLEALTKLKRVSKRSLP